MKFANSEDIVVCKQVIAIGTPITFSLRNSATVGHISGLNRSVGEPYRLVQTDTAITHGNSGGALINMNGELVGITSSGYSGTNTNFAVPVDTVKYVLNQFELYGKSDIYHLVQSSKRTGLQSWEFRQRQDLQ